MGNLRERWRSMGARVSRTWTVLREGTPGFMFATGLGLSVLVGWFLASDLASGIRYSGAVLQVLGIVLVAHSLDENRALFGRPTMTERIRSWIARLLTSGQPRNIVFHVGTGAITATGATVRAQGSVAGGSLEHRVEMLEADIRSLRKDVWDSDIKTRAEVSALKSELCSEVQRRVESDARVERLVAEIAVGGLHLEWVGLSWLVIATIFSAVPDELARLLS